MTHVKNVESFTRLIGFCAGYGGKYNPGSPNLRMDSLTAQLEAAKLAMEQVKVTRSLFDLGINTRRQRFETLPAVVSKILLTITSSGAKRELVEDARYLVRQINGYSLTNREPVASAKTEEAKTRRSVLQLAYVSKADWFGKLVQVAEIEPSYNPNEEMLVKPALLAKAAELNASISAVNQAQVMYSNALIARNKALYSNEHSLCNLMRAARQYIGAVYGKNSAEYAQVKSLSFTKPGNA